MVDTGAMDTEDNQEATTADGEATGAAAVVVVVAGIGAGAGVVVVHEWPRWSRKQVMDG